MLQVNEKYATTKRIQRLREKVLQAKPSICTERAKVYTEIYRNHESEPVIIKRALALEKMLKEMSIFIDEEELIVGNHSSQLRAHRSFRSMLFPG